MSIFDNTVSPAVAEARLLHPQESGFFTVGAKAGNGRWKEDHFDLSKLDAVSQSLRGRADTYISQATFASRLRKSYNAKSLRCVFVDLDYYNTDLAQTDVQILADRVIERARSLGVPDPSYIASSGKGLYVKWVFDTPINATLMPGWKLMQKKLVSAYLPMGADQKVVDPARVLRSQETINSKSGSVVHLLREGQTHAFADLAQKTAHLEIFRIDKTGSIVKGTPTIQHKNRRVGADELFTDEALTDQVGLDLYAASRTPIMLSRISKQSLNWCRFLDMRDLVQMRGGVRRGSRDITLFWMVNFLAQAGVIDAHNFWTEVKALLASFPVTHDFNPLHDGSLNTLLSRIQAQARGEKVIFDGSVWCSTYTPGNNALLNMLQISPDEELHLRTIISGAEKLRRADEKVPGRSERRVERCQSQEVAVTLHSEGMNFTQIARTLGRNKSTISRWLKPIDRVGLPYHETRGRKPCAGTTLVKLTGRGPVVTSTRSPSMHDIRRKTRVRQQKAHLRPGHTPWSHEQVRQWLAERNRLPHPGNGVPMIASQKNLEAAAHQLVANLMQQLRRSSLAAGDSIFIPSTPSVSSSTIAAPPGPGA